MESDTLSEWHYAKHRAEACADPVAGSIHERQSNNARKTLGRQRNIGRGAGSGRNVRRKDTAKTDAVTEPSFLAPAFFSQMQVSEGWSAAQTK